MGKGRSINRDRDENESEEDEGKQPFDADKIKHIIERIGECEEQMAEAREEIKELKKSALDAGVSVKELAEALKMLKLTDKERDLLVSQAGRCCEAVGRMPINTRSFEN